MRAKGFRGFRSTHFRYAKDAIYKAESYAYRDRKVRKRMFRRLWVQRINAGARALGITYSRLIEGLAAAGIEVNRKTLSETAIHDEAAFKLVVEKAKAALENKRSA